MAEEVRLHHPWLLAVWPGMGHVAFNAGYYLLAKLGMNVIAEYEGTGLFDVEQVEVKEGIIQKGRHPRNRFFLWEDPRKEHDLVVFLGEAQPPIGKDPFCHQIIAYARELGVERVFTFAAVATEMDPGNGSRVFGAATDSAGLEELQDQNVEILREGHIAGLNGVLLGAVAESGLRGCCLLGEMPQLFRQLPYPRASLAVLEVFTSLTEIPLDFTELTEQVQLVEEKLGELLEQVEELSEEYPAAEVYPAAEEASFQEPAEEERLSAADQKRIERLFKLSGKDRAKAFELKQELDRLGVFGEYEDRFLDLFKKPR